MTAIGTNPTAVNGSTIHSEVTINRLGVKSGTTMDTSFSDLTIPSFLTMLAGKQALSTASGLWSDFKGDPLKTFSEDGFIHMSQDLKVEEINEVEKKAGALDSLKRWSDRGNYFLAVSRNFKCTSILTPSLSNFMPRHT